MAWDAFSHKSILGVPPNIWGGFQLVERNPQKFLQYLDTTSEIFILKFIPLTDSIRSIFQNQEIFELLIKSVTLPDTGFENVTIKKLGYNRNIAGDINVGNLSITSYSDYNGLVPLFYHEYYQYIIEGADSKYNFRPFPNEYKINIEVTKLSKEENIPSLRYILKKCYPTNIGTLGLDFENFDTAPSFQVDFIIDEVEVINFDLPEPKGVKGNKHEKNIIHYFSELSKQIAFFESIKTKNALGRPPINQSYKLINLSLLKTIERSLKQKLIAAIQEAAQLILRKAKYKFQGALPAILRGLGLDQKENINKLFERLKARTLSELSDVMNEILRNF